MHEQDGPQAEDPNYLDLSNYIVNAINDPILRDPFVKKSDLTVRIDGEALCGSTRCPISIEFELFAGYRYFRITEMKFADKSPFNVKVTLMKDP